MRLPLLTLALSLTTATLAFSAPDGLRTVRTGAQSNIQKPEQVVVRSEAEWQALWKRHSASKVQAEDVPKVDWSREMVLAVFLGSRSTGGYSVKIVDAREVNGKLEVRTEQRSPAPDGFVSQGFTSPFHLVAAPKSSLPVVWKKVSPPR
jgi:hypothetical protein